MSRRSLPSYTLYGAHWSLYTAKTRSFLCCKGLPFQEVEASREIYERVIKPHTGREVVPALVTPDGEFLQDSTEINDILEERFPQPCFIPATPRQRLISHLFDAYANEWLRIPALYYRWSFQIENEDFLMADFGRTYMPRVHPSQQRSYGHAQSLPFRRRLQPLGITSRTGPAIERWTEAFLREFDNHLAEHAYLLGDRPCMADFSLMGPLYAHIYRDPHSSRVLQRVAPRAISWIDRMHSNAKPDGEFLAGDVIPETLHPVLRRLFVEFIPVVKEASSLIVEEARKAPGKQLPRHFGSQPYKLEAIIEERAVFPHMMWMMQRPVAYYLSLDETARKGIDECLLPLGGSGAFAFSDECWLERSNYELVLNAARRAVDVSAAANGRGPARRPGTR